MNIEEFAQIYIKHRDVDKVEVDTLCNHPQHIDENKEIAKGPAKRNFLKHGGREFICRSCEMKYNNPVHLSGSRQTDEEIVVICPHPNHQGEPARIIKQSCYYGEMIKPYKQICRSCSQIGKEVHPETKELISNSLKGIKRSEEFKQNLSDYMKNNPEGIARANKNIRENQCTTGNLGKKFSDETKLKMSIAHSGKTFSEEHRKNISEGRKKMLQETGGFTKEHRENISKAVSMAYASGFNPLIHHRKGWHESEKSGKVYFRSSYEKKAYMMLDKDETVLKYFPEKVKLSFYNPEKQITGQYFVDLIVEYTDGRRILVEIKPEAFLSDQVVMAKCEVAKKYAQENNIAFEIWTEMKLFGQVYNEKHMRDFVALEIDKDPDYIEKRKAKSRVKSNRHYDNVISQDKVSTYCEYCKTDHQVLRKTYNNNIDRNGRYICEREGGFIAGSKPGKKKINEHLNDGKKQCNRCQEVKLFEEFGIDKTKSDGYATRCKVCRATVSAERYKKK